LPEHPLRFLHGEHGGDFVQWTLHDAFGDADFPAQVRQTASHVHNDYLDDSTRIYENEEGNQ
jgi:hypothetical protein